MKKSTANFGKVVTIPMKIKSCGCKGDKGCSCDPQCRHCTSQVPHRTTPTLPRG